MADQYKDLSHTAAQIDSTIDGFSAHAADTVSHVTLLDRESWSAKAEAADLDAKADQTALTAEAQAREDADTALQTAVDSKIPLTLGTPLLTAETWDLFTLPVGKYYRQSTVSDVQNIPSDLTVAFYCIIENTISASRRRILLYPATASLAGTFYCCVETSAGYGSWYKFEGTAVT